MEYMILHTTLQYYRKEVNNMGNFEILFKEVEHLQKELKSFQRGLISYGEVYHTLVNISVLVEYLLEYNQNDRG